MLVLNLAAYAALVLSAVGAFLGLRRWAQLRPSQRWFSLYLLGSFIIGLALAITACLHIKNWLLMNAWSCWIAVTLGPAISERLLSRDRYIARALFTLWLVAWISARVFTGFSSWEGYLHPILCGLLLGVGMSAFDQIIKDDLPFWRNGQAILVVAASLMAACDAVTWASMRLYTPATNAGFVSVWTARNLAMLPVSALYLLAFQVSE